MLSAPLESLPLVTPGSFLTLHYRMAAAAVNGQPGADIINTFAGKPATLSLGGGQLSPALEQRLLGLFKAACRSGLAAQAILDQLFARLDRFVGPDRQLEDDASMVVLKVREELMLPPLPPG